MIDLVRACGGTGGFAVQTPTFLQGAASERNEALLEVSFLVEQESHGHQGEEIGKSIRRNSIAQAVRGESACRTVFVVVHFVLPEGWLSRRAKG
ncbi:hypothetical protein [Ensifer adhaerens]|uniref:hypothetical protein n=1 Tax=Ensifer adhaerens TaxID=106592 RepID=UPI001319ED11|nr:hypothetical protein [Ensifer adhaerens]